MEIDYVKLFLIGDLWFTDRCIENLRRKTLARCIKVIKQEGDLRAGLQYNGSFMFQIWIVSWEIEGKF